MTDRRVVVITGGSAGLGRAAAGPHGIFDADAKDRSLQSQLSMHRRLAAGTVSGVALVAMAARRRR